MFALGFGHGPWDESSLRDIRDDSMVTDRPSLNRDDVVTTVLSTFRRRSLRSLPRSQVRPDHDGEYAACKPSSREWRKRNECSNQTRRQLQLATLQKHCVVYASAAFPLFWPLRAGTASRSATRRFAGPAHCLHRTRDFMPDGSFRPAPSPARSTCSNAATFTNPATRLPEHWR